MVTISTELGFLILITSFFGIYSFITALPNFPNQMKFVNPIGSAILTVGIPTVVGACVIPSGLLPVVGGIPCIVALGVYTGVTLVIAYYSANPLASLLILTPALVGIIYIISKLARGGG